MNSKDPSFEIVKGVRVTEAKDHAWYKPERMEISKYKQFDCALNGATLPVQTFMCRLAKHYPFTVCNSQVDAESKSVKYEVVANANETTIKSISFDEAAKCFGWKSFTVSENGQTIVPQK